MGAWADEMGSSRQGARLVSYLANISRGILCEDDVSLMQSCGQHYRNYQIPGSKVSRRQGPMSALRVHLQTGGCLNSASFLAARLSPVSRLADSQIGRLADWQIWPGLGGLGASDNKLGSADENRESRITCSRDRMDHVHEIYEKYR